jgi:hypothetical protein
MNNVFPKAERDYPIPERENLLRALNHQKPLWMPNFEGGSQDIGLPGVRADGLKDGETYQNEWGVTCQYSEAQGSATPIKMVFSSVTEWEKKLVVPNLDIYSYEQKAAAFKRDGRLAVGGHLFSACFEQLHTLEGFEQALIDLITEPEACRAYFEAMVDFQLAHFERMNNAYHFDYILYHDDWGTARAPFFSVDLFKETILEPTIRLAKGIRESGVKLMFHNCGLINDFVPYLVDDIGSDGLQIQTINDTGKIIRDFGEKVTVEYRRPDPYLLFDPDTTEAQIRELARWIVDSFGAHANPGAGAMVTVNAPSAEVYNAFDEEVYRYSLDKYRNL